MKLIEIDESKCKRDGLCVSDCPSGIIRLVDGGFPEVIRGGEKFCLQCGHCVAVCPHGALSHVHSPMLSSPLIRENLLVNREQVVQLLRSRRSVRQYRTRDVEREKIRELIEIARYAPTGGNTQMVEWVVFTKKEELNRFAELTVDWVRNLLQTVPVEALPPYFPPILSSWEAGRDTILRNAPVLILALTPAEARNGLVDVSIALTYFQLAALPLGLGTCWAGLLQGALLQWPPLKEAMGLPHNSPNLYPVMLGYPVLDYHRAPERKRPKIEWR